MPDGCQVQKPVPVSCIALYLYIQRRPCVALAYQNPFAPNCRALLSAFGAISQMCERLGLKDNVKGRSHELFKQVLRWASVNADPPAVIIALALQLVSDKCHGLRACQRFMTWIRSLSAPSPTPRPPLASSLPASRYVLYKSGQGWLNLCCGLY